MGAANVALVGPAAGPFGKRVVAEQRAKLLGDLGTCVGLRPQPRADAEPLETHGVVGLVETLGQAEGRLAGGQGLLRGPMPP